LLTSGSFPEVSAYYYLIAFLAVEPCPASLQLLSAKQTDKLRG
jgi:hypothetical protein